EAVEEAAQKVLRARGQRRAETEHRMRRHTAGREDGGDQRLSIGRARNVAVREPSMLVPSLAQEPLRVGTRDDVTDIAECDAERLQMLTLHDRQERIGELVSW